MGPTATLLPDGKRLHLQHGPIDLVIGADGQRNAAFDAAGARFETMLEELVAELPELRMALCPGSPRPNGRVAKRMHDATIPFGQSGFLTRMAAVAGAVADEVLQAMIEASDLRRAYVNNGGDIALHLEGDAHFTTAMMDHRGRPLGQITITAGDAVRGIATSGRHGRSHSFGIADSVTVLARSAATADVAATLIANAVDLPGHAAIQRRPACQIDEDSDLGDRPVVIGCDPLTSTQCMDALRTGHKRAMSYTQNDLICGTAIFLQTHAKTTASTTAGHLISLQNREQHYA